jgi:hypothetical protein
LQNAPEPNRLRQVVKRVEKSRREAFPDLQAEKMQVRIV